MDDMATQPTFTLVSDRTPRTPFKMAVRLDGKVAGHILSEKTDSYFYQPNGSRVRGETFDTFDACAESLS